MSDNEFEKTKKSDVLHISERRTIHKLLEAKGKQLVTALGNEISADETTIQSRMLANKGFSMNSRQLSGLMRELEIHRKELISSIDDDEEVQSMSIQESELELEFNRKSTLLSQQYESKKIEITAWKNAEKDKIKKEKDLAFESLARERDKKIEDIIANRAPTLAQRIIETKKNLEEVMRVERDLVYEAKRRSEIMKQAQTRLQYLVRDTVLETQTLLMSATLRTDAMDLLEKLPSVQELIYIVESDGVDALITRMKPKFTMSLPQGSYTENKKPDEEGDFLMADEGEIVDSDVAMVDAQIITSID